MSDGTGQDAPRFRAELVDPTGQLLSEITHQGLFQRDIAQTYAMAMTNCGDDVDWPAVNRAIVTRWSKAGLVRVKEMAWKILDESC